MSIQPDQKIIEPDALDTLLREIIAEWDAERLRQMSTMRYEVRESIVVLVLNGIISGLLWKLVNYQPILLAFFAFIVSMLIFIANAVRFLSYRNNIHWVHSLLTQMRAFNDVRTLPYELEAYQWFEGKDKANIASITSLLLRLTPDDASLMKPHLSKIVGFLTQNRLREVNHDRSWRRIVLAGLTALKNVGDSSVIPAVEKAAEMHAVTGNEARIVVFAKDCLLTLQNRAEQQAISQTLLRPANSLGEQGELLRAAALTEQNPDELLRIPLASGTHDPIAQ